NEIMIENIMKNEKQLMLPETVWLENIPKWKNALYCYPLAQSYANIDLSVSRKRFLHSISPRLTTSSSCPIPSHGYFEKFRLIPSYPVGP
ncbi:unnamed protein product, partial [Didymodactylos carnosus]